MSAENTARMLNEHASGWAKATGLCMTRASPDEVCLEWVVTAEQLQPFGLVHGGVYCGVVETVCSVGALLAAAARGFTGTVVGVENHTSFIRAARTGATLRARATPLTRGRSTQVWQAEILDASERLMATGRVRLLCMASDLEPTLASPSLDRVGSNSESISE